MGYLSRGRAPWFCVIQTDTNVGDVGAEKDYVQAACRRLRTLQICRLHLLTAALITLCIIPQCSSLPCDFTGVPIQVRTEDELQTALGTSEAVIQITANIQLSKSLILGPSVRLRGAARGTTISCAPGLQDPVITDSVAGASICVENLSIARCSTRGPLIALQRSATLSLTRVTIANNTITHQSMLSFTNGATFFLDQVIIQRNNVSLEQPLLNMVFPNTPAGAPSLHVAKSQITQNTAGRLFSVWNSTACGDCATGTQPPIQYSDASLLRHLRNSSTRQQYVRHLARQSGSLVLDDVNIAQNRVMTDLVAVYRMHVRINRCRLQRNKGLLLELIERQAQELLQQAAGTRPPPPKLPPNAPPNSPPAPRPPPGPAPRPSRHFNIKVPRLFPAVALYHSNTGPTIEASLNCTAPVVQGRPVECVNGWVGAGDVERVAGSLVHLFQSSLYLVRSNVSQNEFVNGSLVEARRHSAVVMEDLLVTRNRAETVVNMTGHTAYLDRALYNAYRLEDDRVRNQNKPTTFSGFQDVMKNLKKTTDAMHRYMQSTPLNLFRCNITENNMTLGVIRGLGSRSDWRKELEAFENATLPIILHTNIINNTIPESSEISNLPFGWIMPSVLGFLHTNLTVENTNISFNSAPVILNVEAASVSFLSSTFSSNTPVGVQSMWYIRAATVRVHASNFTNNANFTKSMLHVTLSNVWMLNSSFSNNTMGPRIKEQVARVSELDQMQSCVKGWEGTVVAICADTLAGVRFLDAAGCDFTNNTASAVMLTSMVQQKVIDLQFRYNNGTSLFIGTPDLVYDANKPVSDGTTCVQGVLFERNAAKEGGTFNVQLHTEGQLQISESYFTNNQAVNGSGVHVEIPQGGSKAAFDISSCWFTNNNATGYGGGIYVQGSETRVNIDDTTLEGNSAYASGGGVYIEGPVTATVMRTRMRSNQAASGGGLTANQLSSFEIGATNFINNNALLHKADQDPSQAAEYWSECADDSLMSQPCGVGAGGAMCFVEPRRRSLNQVDEIVNCTLQGNQARFGGVLSLDCGGLPACLSSGRSAQFPCCQATLINTVSSDSSATVSGYFGWLTRKDSIELCDDVNPCELITEASANRRFGLWSAGIRNGAKNALAFAPVSITAILNPNDTDRFDSSEVVTTGGRLPLTIQLVDAYNRIVTDTPGGFMVTPVVKPRGALMVRPANNTKLILNQQMYNFTILPTQMPTNQSSKVMMTVKPGFSVQDLVPVNLTLIMPRCTLGQHLNDVLCSHCDFNLQFSLNPSLRCEPCPDNADCTGGFVRPKHGYFQPSFLLPQLIACPIFDACSPNRSMIKPGSALFQELNELLTQAGLWPVPSPTAADPQTSYFLEPRPPSNTTYGELQLYLLRQAAIRFMNGDLGVTCENGNLSYKKLKKLYTKLQCAEGYEGQLCSECSRSYGSHFGSCRKCLPLAFNLLILILATVVLVGILAFMTNAHMQKVCRRVAARRAWFRSYPSKDEIILPQPSTHQASPPKVQAPPVTRSSTMQAVSDGSHRTLPLSVQDALRYSLSRSYEEDEEAKDAVSMIDPAVAQYARAPSLTPADLAFSMLPYITKVLVSFGQVNALLGTLQLTLPALLRRFLTSMDSSLAWISIDCALPAALTGAQKAFANDITIVVLPGVCLLCAVLFWAARCNMLRLQGHLKGPRWRGYITQRLWLTIVQILYLLYPRVSSSIFRIFSCQRLGDRFDRLTGTNYDYATRLHEMRPTLSSNMTNGTGCASGRDEWLGDEYWVGNYGVKCWEGGHKVLVWAVGAPALVMFAVGVPLALVTVLWNHKHKLHQPKTMLQFGFLYEEYDEKLYFWEGVIMARKVGVLGATVLGRLRVSAYLQILQVTSCLLLIQICLCAHIICQPFKYGLLNLLEGFSLLATIINLVLLSYFIVPELSAGLRYTVVILVLLLNIVMFIVFAGSLAYYLWKSLRRSEPNTWLRFFYNKLRWLETCLPCCPKAPPPEASLSATRGTRQFPSMPRTQDGWESMPPENLRYDSSEILGPGGDWGWDPIQLSGRFGSGNTEGALPVQDSMVSQDDVIRARDEAAAKTGTWSSSMKSRLLWGSGKQWDTMSRRIDTDSRHGWDSMKTARSYLAASKGSGGMKSVPSERSDGGINTQNPAYGHRRPSLQGGSQRESGVLAQTNNQQPDVHQAFVHASTSARSRVGGSNEGRGSFDHDSHDGGIAQHFSTQNEQGRLGSSHLDGDQDTVAAMQGRSTDHSMSHGTSQAPDIHQQHSTGQHPVQQTGLTRTSSREVL